jgi:hypothetical protein
LRTELKRSITHFSDIARKPYQKRALLSLKDLSDLWHLEKNSSGKVIFTINKTSDAVKLVEKGKMKLSELLVMLESTIPYESLLYYLNLNKVDIPGVNHKKIETAEMMFKIGILTKNELDKLREKYGS